MRVRSTRALCSLAVAVTTLASTVASAQSSPRVAARQSLPAGAGPARLGTGTPPTGARTPVLLRADQPNRDLVSPDPVTGDASIVHGHAAGLNVNGMDLSGVARLSIATSAGNFFCSGALIGPRTLVTAAHCVTDDLTGAVISPNNGVTARFYGPNGFIDYVSSAVRASPFWMGFSNPLSWGGDDLAIVHFDAVAEPWMAQYDLFLGDPFFQTSMEVGYGLYGNGTQGPVGFDGRRRWGLNRVDLLTSDGILWTDFDNGQVLNDAWCWADGYAPGSPFCDTGYGAFESSLGSGDSGGPMFINGQLAGVASFSTYFCDPSSPTTCVPGSPPLADPNVAGFGALNGHAWVALNEDWVNAQVAAIPEPSTVALVGGGLVLLLGAARRRKR